LGAITDVKASITIDFNYGGEGGGIGGAELLAGVDLNGNGIIGKARGGPVSSSTPYIVGEAGPELFVPNSSGNIVPNNKLTGNTATNSAQTGTGGGGFTDRDLRKLSRYIAEEVARTSR